MQTLADVQFLDLELSGLSKQYQIDSIKQEVFFEAQPNLSFIRSRVAHLDTVGGKPTLYSELTDLFGDTNAYAFHNLYPYKGKYYPRLVRSILNAFDFNEGRLVLDPYNGCGTTTHECGLMGIRCVGLDINPIGNLIASMKNELPFVEASELDLSVKDLETNYNDLRKKKLSTKKMSSTLYRLLLLVYFDTVDAFSRTTRYNKKGELGLFIEKFHTIRDYHSKFVSFMESKGMVYKPSEVLEGSVLDLAACGIEDNSFDGIITSPPYYFSLDYVGKDKIAYDYLNEIGFFKHDMDEVKQEYLGMKVKPNLAVKRLAEKRVVTYFADLEKSVEEMARVLKVGGKIAIVIGDSSLEGRKLPTTRKTHEFCLEQGLRPIRTIFNPLLGARNRAIRGESVLLYEK